MDFTFYYERKIYTNLHTYTGMYIYDPTFVFF